MCAPLIIATGWWSAGGTVRMGRRVACFLFIGGTVATFVEAWTLLHTYGVPLEGHDFLLATPFQVWGLLNLLRLYPSWAVGTPLPQWGRYTLGVYAGHVAVMEVLGAREGGGLLWEFLKTPLVYLLTLSVVGLLARWPRVRPFFA
jgi:surface polysaccharide O-acyltransferase-like enzyme